MRGVGVLWDASACTQVNNTSRPKLRNDRVIRVSATYYLLVSEDPASPISEGEVGSLVKEVSSMIKIGDQEKSRCTSEPADPLPSLNLSTLRRVVMS
jgi:hypothetical protein